MLSLGFFKDIFNFNQCSGYPISIHNISGKIFSLNFYPRGGFTLCNPSPTNHIYYTCVQFFKTQQKILGRCDGTGLELVLEPERSVSKYVIIDINEERVCNSMRNDTN